MPFQKSKNNTYSAVLVPLASQFQDTSGILPPQSSAPQNTLDILNNERTLSQPPHIQPIRTFGGNRLNRSGIHESTQYTTPVQSSSQGSSVKVGGGINAHDLRCDENGRSYGGVKSSPSGNVRLGESGANTRSHNRQLANAGVPNDIQAKSNIYIIPALRPAETKKYIIPAHREKLQDSVSSQPQSASSGSRTVKAGGAVPGGLGNVRSSGGEPTIPPSVLLSNGEPPQRLSTRDLVQSIRYGQLGVENSHSSNVQRGFVGNYTAYQQLQSNSTFDTAQSRSDDLKQCDTRRTG